VTYDTEKHIAHLTSKDDLYHTYVKTLEMFKVLKENNVEYDYIFRTNTSTYLLVKQLLSFLEMDLESGPMLYISTLLINQDNGGIPFSRGDFMIFTKSLVDDILNVRGLPYDSMIDDVGIGGVMHHLYGNEYIKEHIKEVDIINNPTMPITKTKSAYAIRTNMFKKYEPATVLLICHKAYKEMEDTIEVSPPHNITKIETLYGVIPL
jgi:hypothetical protein